MRLRKAQQQQDNQPSGQPAMRNPTGASSFATPKRPAQPLVHHLLACFSLAALAQHQQPAAQPAPQLPTTSFPSPSLIPSADPNTAHIVFLTFDEPDLHGASGTFDVRLARRYELQGVILPCERAGPYAGACALENVSSEAALPPATANVLALHGGCMGVPAGFDAFRTHYFAAHAARLAVFGDADCSGPLLGALEVPPIAPVPAATDDAERSGEEHGCRQEQEQGECLPLHFRALPAEGLFRPMGRARSVHLRARDGLLVVLDNITLVREGTAAGEHPNHQAHWMVLSQPTPCCVDWPGLDVAAADAADASCAAAPRPLAAKRGLWASGLRPLPLPAAAPGREPPRRPRAAA